MTLRQSLGNVAKSERERRETVVLWLLANFSTSTVTRNHQTTATDGTRTTDETRTVKTRTADAGRLVSELLNKT